MPNSLFISSPLTTHVASSSVNANLTLIQAGISDFLGWEDLSPSIAIAGQRGSALSRSFQNAYAIYRVAPIAKSKRQLRIQLDRLCKEIRQELGQAKKLRLEAEERLVLPAVESNGYLAPFTNFLYKLHHAAQVFFSSDDRSLIERYKNTETRCQVEIATLSQLRQKLDTKPKTTPNNLAPVVNSSLQASRRFLSNPTPPETFVQYCYPERVCNLSILRDGVTGFSFTGTVFGSGFGNAASSIGDMNGDGFADFIVGECRLSPNGIRSVGGAHIVFGSNQTGVWLPTQNIRNLDNGQRAVFLQGEQKDDQLGYFVTGIGDMNGDGNTDTAISAYYQSNFSTGIEVGKVYIVFGNNTWDFGSMNISTLMDGVRGFILYGEVDRGWLGIGLASAGDFNGDGLSDLAVSAPYADTTAIDAGKVYVIFGSKQSNAWAAAVFNISSLIDGVRGISFQSSINYDYLGHDIANAGDINGDGISDLMIWARWPSRIYMIFGSNQTNAWGSGKLGMDNALIDGVRAFSLRVNNGNDNAVAIAAAGDVNGDQLSDVGFVGDINGDHKNDLVVVSNVGDAVTVILGASLISPTLHFTANDLHNLWRYCPNQQQYDSSL